VQGDFQQRRYPLAVRYASLTAPYGSLCFVKISQALWTQLWLFRPGFEGMLGQVGVVVANILSYFFANPLGQRDRLIHRF
jgi:hypothetical protein